MSPIILRSQDQMEHLQHIACSTCAGIWRIKRAKIILGTLEGKSVDRLVLEVRVPPLSIIECRRRFAEEGISYLASPGRGSTLREAAVERIMAFLDHPLHSEAEEWDTLTHRFIGIIFSARQIQAIRELIAATPRIDRTNLARDVCAKFELYQPNGNIRLSTVCTILKRMDMDNVITMPTTRKKARKEEGAPETAASATPNGATERRAVASGAGFRG